MRAIGILWMAAALRLASCSEPELDTDRPAATFTFEKLRPGGHTYVDTDEKKTETSMKFSEDKTMTNKNEFLIESELKVTDLDEGGQEVDYTIERFAFMVESTPHGLNLTCDTNQNKDDAPEACEDVYECKGKSFQFTVDDDGKIVDPDGSVADSMKSVHGSAPKVQQQGRRATRFVPSHPVAPGDEWNEESKELDDDMGEFNGKSTLKGYFSYKGHDVAVIESTGQLTMDVDKLLEKYGRPSENVVVAQLHDATMTATIYWDDAAGIVRWSKMTTVLNMEVNSPIDDTRIEFPIFETCTTTTDIKE